MSDEQRGFGLVGGSLKVEPSRERDRAGWTGDGGQEALTRSITSVMNGEAEYAGRPSSVVAARAGAGTGDG